MADFTHLIENWSNGIVQAVDGDRVPDTALLDAKNTQFWKNSSGDAVIGTRSGLRLSTQFISSSIELNRFRYLATYNYPASDDVAHTRYMAVIDNAGKLVYKEQDDSWDGTELVPPGGYPSPTTCIPPEYVASIDSTVMNGRLFFVAGPISRSLRGKTYEPFGILAPQATASLSATIGGTTIRLPADTYSVWVTAYNSTTGAESNPTFVGDYTTDGGNNGLIQVTFNSTGVLTDKWRIYVQRQSTQAQAYLLTDVYTLGDAQKSSDGNIAIADSTVVVNVSGAVLADLVTPLPDLYENNPLPSGVLYVTTYGRRLVGASRRKVYWSKLDLPDAFPPQNFEIFETPDGSEITGIAPANDELLIVWTTTGTYGIFGLDPQYWVVKPIDDKIGCSSSRSIVKFDGGIGWWSPQYGPVVMRGQEIEKIGLELLGRLPVSPFQIGQIESGWDPESDTIVWAYAGEGDTTNTLLLPFNYRVNRWAARWWDPLPVWAMATGWDANGNPRLFVTDTFYNLWYFDKQWRYDGFGPDYGTIEGTFTAGASTISGVSGTGFYSGLNGRNLRGQMVTVVDSTGALVGRRMVSQQFSTTGLTFDRTMDVTNGATYAFYVGTPYFEISTGHIDAGEAFLRKRFDRLYVDIGASYPVSLLCQVRLNRSPVTVATTMMVTPTAGSTATLDATWDLSVTTSEPFIKKRLNIWKNGHTCQIIISQPKPETVMIRRMMLLGRMLSDRYYA